MWIWRIAVLQASAFYAVVVFAVSSGNAEVISAIVAGVFMTVNSALTLWLTTRKREHRDDGDDDKK